MSCCHEKNKAIQSPTQSLSLDVDQQVLSFEWQQNIHFYPVLKVNVDSTLLNTRRFHYVLVIFQLCLHAMTSFVASLDIGMSNSNSELDLSLGCLVIPQKWSVFSLVKGRSLLLLLMILVLCGGDDNTSLGVTTTLMVL